MTNYIYDGEEVRATGRTAKKMGTPSPRREGRIVKVDPILLEIEPVDTTNGSWTKWVQEAELYEIVDNSTE